MIAEGVFAGDDYGVTVTVAEEDTGEPVDLAGAALVFTLARGADRPPALQLRNGAAGGSDADIRALAPTTDGVVAINLAGASTRGLRGVYEWDLVVRTALAGERTAARGRFEFSGRVTSEALP